MKTSLNIFLLFLILCASCGSRKANDNKETAVPADTGKKFTLPLIPAMLNTPELRADYLVRHYSVSYTHLYRSLSRPSSPPRAKASAMRPYLLLVLPLSLIHILPVLLLQLQLR